MVAFAIPIMCYESFKYLSSPVCPDMQVYNSIFHGLTCLNIY